jgi:hypothetical protein
MLTAKPSLANSPSLTTLPSLAKMLPSSATLPSWAKLPPWANSPSLAKSPSLANSPLGKVVRTRLPWQSCHWGHCQHPACVDAGVVLSSLRTLPWRYCHHCRHSTGVILDVALASCGPPFTGINARLLVVHSSESISLIALASAPSPMAVQPAFAADGARPLVSAFLADLRRCSLPSEAGS